MQGSWIFRPRSPTAWSVGALLGGLALGLLGQDVGAAPVRALAGAVAPLGELWLAALQVTVLPLVITHLLATIVGAPRQSLGSLGARAVLLFVVMLVAAGTFAATAGPLVVSLYQPDPGSLEPLVARIAIPESARLAASAPPASLSGWLVGLVPASLLEAARRGDILPLLLCSAVLGLAITRLPDPQRIPLAQVCLGLAAAMLLIVRWILAFTPVGVFAVALTMALEAGVALAGVLGAFVIIQSGILWLGALLVYPVAALGGRVPLRDFAAAVAPAQLVAVSTRSSIAALPALIEGGRTRLRLPDSATGLVLPLATSIFKLNRPISSTIKLLFLAHVFGVPLTPFDVAGFVATVLLISFTVVGIPGGGGSFRTLPAYLAVGVPLQAVVIVEAVDVIPDIFKTLVNVTGDMAAATLLSRSARAAATVVAPAIGPPAAAQGEPG